MDDNEDANSVLVVVLTYRGGGGTPVTIATSLVGVTSGSWTVPSDVESTAVTITATVTDTGGMTGSDTSPQFEIYKETIQPPSEFPWMWVILIIIIVVVLAIVLLLVMKRRKPKEEEEAAAAPLAAEEAPPAEEE